MIIANCYQTTSGILVRFDIPNSEKGFIQEETTAADRAEVKRKLYFRIRKYITDELQAWLKQRWYAIVPHPSSENYVKRISAIDTMLLQVESYRQTSYKQVIAMVCRQREKLELIAPKETSRHYKHYERTILPIIRHCLEMAGQAE